MIKKRLVTIIVPLTIASLSSCSSENTENPSPGVNSSNHPNNNDSSNRASIFILLARSFQKKSQQGILKKLSLTL